MQGSFYCLPKVRAFAEYAIDLQISLAYSYQFLVIGSECLQRQNAFSPTPCSLLFKESEARDDYHLPQADNFL